MSQNLESHNRQLHPNSSGTQYYTLLQLADGTLASGSSDGIIKIWG